MHRLVVLMILAVVAGCASKPVERDNAEVQMFGAMRMRLHPIFTQVKNWSTGTRPDGVEAEIEFQDQFGDPTKAAGKIMFELYQYRQGYPDPRGDRIVNPWVGSLLTLQEQYQRWNRTSRTYSFQLALPGISERRDYVLTAMFENSDGHRYFSRVILKAQVEEEKKLLQPPPLPEPTTRPVAVP